MNNRIDGVVPDSISNLKYLKFLMITNDAREYSRMYADVS